MSNEIVDVIDQAKVYHGTSAVLTFKSTTDPESGLSIDLDWVPPLTDFTMENLPLSHKHMAAVVAQAIMPMVAGLEEAAEPTHTVN